uniref:Calcipressin-2 n=1 Tax=Rhabditophanes sp. KR3021 TaxID=114890 RepID=A0AC35TM23_9BILA
MATFFLDQILDEPANTHKKTPHNSKESSGTKTDAAPEITNLDILADNKLFMNKCIYGSGLFDDFIEKQLPIISNLEVFKTTDAELKWKIAAAIKQEFSKPTNKRKSKEQMYEELLKQHESNILVSTRIRIAIENYANSESVRTEIQSMLTTEKTKLVPPEPKYDIIREKLLTLGNRQNCEKGRIRKSRFSEIVGSSKIPPIGLVNLTKAKNNGGSEIKPIQLPTCCVPTEPNTEDNDLPTAIIITEVPLTVFDDQEEKTNFANLFVEFQPDMHFDFLRSFHRVRIIFANPEHATAALMLVKHYNYKGKAFKAFFARNIKFQARTYQDSNGHLQLPPQEKLFLISPPSSPPVGWSQSIEMAPVVCNFDLMTRLAAFTIEDNFEVYEGGKECPSIIVSPCKENATEEEYMEYKEKFDFPATPRPPTCT